MIGKIFWKEQAGEFLLCTEPAAKLLQLYQLATNEYKVMCLGCQTNIIAKTLERAKDAAIEWFLLLIRQLDERLRVTTIQIMGSIAQHGHYLWQKDLTRPDALLHLVERNIVKYQDTRGIFHCYKICKGRSAEEFFEGKYDAQY